MSRKPIVIRGVKEDVYIELSGSVGVIRVCAAAAWDKLYGSKLERVGFQRGLTTGVVFYHKEIYDIIFLS